MSLMSTKINKFLIIFGLYSGVFKMPVRPPVCLSLGFQENITIASNITNDYWTQFYFIWASKTEHLKQSSTKNSLIETLMKFQKYFFKLRFWIFFLNFSIYLFKHIFIEFNYKIKNLYFIYKKILCKINIKFNSSTHFLGVYGQ